MNKIGLAKDDYSGLEQYYIQKVLKIVENIIESMDLKIHLKITEALNLLFNLVLQSFDYEGT
jgi:hypothetical protein